MQHSASTVRSSLNSAVKYAGAAIAFSTMKDPPTQLQVATQ